VDLTLLESTLSTLGEPPYRARQVWEWTAHGATGYEAMTNLPASLRSELARAIPFSTLTLVHEAKSVDGTVKALDAKVTIDDSALFRHPDVAEMRDIAAADPLEAFAREKGVTYVKLDGSVGILGNGAGLSMSTVDVVVVAGGKPANFCDLGGGGDAQGVVDALEVITRDRDVRSILFNIFGGITRGDEVARGILTALDQMSIELPLVVRLDGTNAEEGRALLTHAALPNVHVEPTMLDAARRAVELAA